MNSSSIQRPSTDLPTIDGVTDPCSPDRPAASGGLPVKAVARVALTLGSAAVLAACSTTAERPSADYSRADSAVSSQQGPIKSPAAERVVGGIVDMVLSQRLASTIDEARRHPVGQVRDGQPLYLYIQSKRPLGELAHPADPYSKHSFSSYPHLFVQIGDNHSMRIINTCYVTLTPSEAKGHALVVPLAPLSKRVGDVPSDCWLETMTQADPVRQTLEVRLAGFPGRFESWLPVPDLLGVEAVDVDLRRGAGAYAGMLRADPTSAPALVSTLGAKTAKVDEADKAKAAADASRRREANAAEATEAARKAAREQAQADMAARQAREQKAREAAEAARLPEEKRLADEKRAREQAEAARVAAEARRVSEQAEAARLADEKRVREQAESARRLAGAGSVAGASVAVGGAAGSAAKGAAMAGATAAGTVAKGVVSAGQRAENGGAKKDAAVSTSVSSPAESARSAAQQAQAASIASRRVLAALPAGARLTAVTPLLPAKPRNVGGTRMAVQLRSLTATLLGRQPSETYFTDRQWQTQPGRSRRDARQTIHAIAVFRGEECSWQSLLVSRRPNASTIAEVAADGDEVPIACPDLDR